MKLTINLASLDVVRDILGAAAVDLAANGESGTEDLENSALQLTGEGLVGATHGAGDVEDLIHGDRLGVLDVLLLLAIARGLLQGADDERRGGGNDRDSGLTVLDGQADGDTETFLWTSLGMFGIAGRAVAYPVTGGLRDIFTDLLGRQTKGTDLGSEGGRRTDFTASGAKVAVTMSAKFSKLQVDGRHVHDLHLIGI